MPKSDYTSGNPYVMAFHDLMATSKDFTQFLADPAERQGIRQGGHPAVDDVDRDLSRIIDDRVGAMRGKGGGHALGVAAGDDADDDAHDDDCDCSSAVEYK